MRAPLALEAVLHHSQRSKFDRYRGHLFPTAYAARPDSGTGTGELAAFITSQALITGRKDDGLDIDAVVQRWDDNPNLVLLRRIALGELRELARGIRTPPCWSCRSTSRPCTRPGC